MVAVKEPNEPVGTMGEIVSQRVVSLDKYPKVIEVGCSQSYLLSLDSRPLIEGGWSMGRTFHRLVGRTGWSIGLLVGRSVQTTNRATA